MKSAKIFTILAGIVVILGMHQLIDKHDLLADVDSDVCCEDGDVKDYYIPEGGHLVKKIRRCSAPAHILELENCSTQATKTCGECIDRQNTLELCWLTYENDYCCEIDPTVGYGQDDYCPEQYKRYACNWPTASVSGPSSLLPYQSGTFTATVTGEPSYSYAWYKWRTCGQNCTPEDEGGDTNDLTCCQWKSIGYNSSLQTQDQWDFYLKVEVTDNCWAGQRTVTSPAFYVYVGEMLAKRNAQETTAQLSGNPEVFNDVFSNYPNPFNAGTTISFILPQANRVSAVIYNIHGQRVNTLISEQELAAGQHQIVWNSKTDHGKEVTSGLYFCRLMSGNHVKLIRLVMIK